MRAGEIGKMSSALSALPAPFLFVPLVCVFGISTKQKESSSLGAFLFIFLFKKQQIAKYEWQLSSRMWVKNFYC